MYRTVQRFSVSQRAQLTGVRARSTVAVMLRSSLVRVVGMLAVASLISVPAVARGDGADVMPSQTPPAGTPAEVVAAFPSVASSLRQTYPGITDAQVWTAWDSMQARLLFLEDVGGTRGFMGATFDPRENLLHLKVDPGADQTLLVARALEYDVPVIVEELQYSSDDLNQLVADISERFDVYGANPLGLGVAAESTLAYVAVSVPDAATLEELPADLVHDPRIRAQVRESYFEPTACVSRTSCGTPARSGVVIGIDADGAGSGVAGQTQSTGFTASATDGSRWIVTSAHNGSGGTLPTTANCPSASACWGHGQQYFGPMREAVKSGLYHVDVARIRKDNPYWSTGGYMYSANTLPSRLINVDFSIFSRTSLAVGSPVCQTSWSSDTPPTCGTITDLSSSDPWLAGAVASTPGSCLGDSGGGWYLLAGAGQRWAVGIQSGATHPPPPPPLCTHSMAETSIWSAIPDIEAYWRMTADAIIRFEDRP